MRISDSANVLVLGMKIRTDGDGGSVGSWHEGVIDHIDLLKFIIQWDTISGIKRWQIGFNSLGQVEILDSIPVKAKKSRRNLLEVNGW